MIKDVMVRLDGTAADEVRLAAAGDIAETLEGQVIGLYLNVMPVLVPVEGDTIGAIRSAEMVERARAAGDKVVKVSSDQSEIARSRSGAAAPR